MAGNVEISEVLKNAEQWEIIDVRSPGEFQSGHIPGAKNIPLFTDEERAVIGTLYKQTSPDAAMTAGLKIAGAKMHVYLEQTLSIINQRNYIAVHCWRGGKRSESMQWLFNFSGINAARISGGYKSYRNAMQSFFVETNFHFKVIGGYTGSGKTELLHEIAKRGHQVIDLEKLANHKGSAFGAIGEPQQPTNEQFENNLYEAFLKLDLRAPIWVENESRNIGKVYLPETVWTKMRNAILYNVEVDSSIRLERAISYYTQSTHIEILKDAFAKIKKRLGGLEYQNAVLALENNELKMAASIALIYYDKSYMFQLQSWPPERVIHFENCADISESVDRLLST